MPFDYDRDALQPKEVEPKLIGHCAYSGDPIVEDDSYYSIEDDLVLEENFTEYAVRELDARKHN